MTKSISTDDAAKIRKAQVANILKRLASGRTITAAQQSLLDAETAEPKKSTPVEKGYSINALSNATGADRRTITKAIQVGKIAPIRTVKGKPQYSLETVQAALATKPDKSLKDELLLEQIRKVRIANDAAEGKLIRRDLVDSTLSKSFGEITRLLDQRLENEFPALCVGLDIPGIRTKGKQLNDAIRAELTKLVEAWKE